MSLIKKYGWFLASLIFAAIPVIINKLMLLTSGMRHPKYFFRSNRGLMARCSSVRKRVRVSFCWLYGNLIVTVGIVLAISSALSTLIGNFISFIILSGSLYTLYAMKHIQVPLSVLR